MSTLILTKEQLAALILCAFQERDVSLTPTSKKIADSLYTGSAVELTDAVFGLAELQGLPVLADGLSLVAAERIRQIKVEGFGPAFDATYGREQLARAAACYALPARDRRMNAGVPIDWPFTAQWWKPGDRKRELEKAGALIVAGLDRILAREAAEANQQKGPNP